MAISGIDGNSDTVTTGDYLIGGLGDLTIADDLRLQNILLLGKEDGKILVFGKIFKMDKERIAAEPQQVTVNIGGRVERSVDPDGIQRISNKKYLIIITITSTKTIVSTHSFIFGCSFPNLSYLLINVLNILKPLLTCF